VALNLWEALGQGFEKPWFNWLFTVFGILALLVVEPFYAAAGFALYLNRRTELEGWDLEQAFRGLADRLRHGGRVVLLLLALAVTMRAQDQATPVGEGAVKPPFATLQPNDPARERLERMLREDPDLKRTRTELVIRYKPTGHEPRWLHRFLDALFGESKPDSPKDFHKPAWWMTVAWILKVLMVLVLVGLVLWILIRFHATRLSRLQGEDIFEAPDAIAGLDVRSESLPEDVPAVALAHFRDGDPRAALALLYRGALASLIHRDRILILPSATEGDCLRAARLALAEEPAAFFTRLTASWVRMAYCGQTPELPELEGLCLDWRTTFGRHTR